jgi:amino acid adenylation domain-containing protein
MAAQLDAPIAAAFEKSVALFADSVALEADGTALTYDALNRAANRLAHAIVLRLGASDERVAFLTDGGSAPYVCLLAALKAGKPYVALDPTRPEAQLAAICADTEPRLILAVSSTLILARQLAGVSGDVLDVDAIDASLPDENPAVEIPVSRPAAIYFTSGSTGKPKGIYYDHPSLLHRLFATVVGNDTRPGDRQALYIHLDNSWSATILFSTLLSGGTLCPINVRQVGVPRMAQWVASERITHFSMTSSLFRQWMDVLPYADEWRYPAMRFLSAGAEPLTRRDVELFKQHFPPACVLFHSLSTSESGRIASVGIRRETPLPEERVPSGYADLDKEVLIVDDDGRWAAPGEIGEIAVRSRYMMGGYWRQPQMTAAVIRPDPEGSDKRIYYTGDLGRIRRDGQLEVLGRRDFQVKVRGYRVQPSEIEQRLFELGTINEAVVVALDEPNGDKRLVAYLAIQGEALSVAELRAALAKTLPDYMIPSAFVFLPAMPLTPGGKVDRRALPPPPRERPQLSNAYVAPRSALEAQLVRIWEDVLPIAPIGVDDDFLELGGDSLRASQVLVRVQRDLGASLSPIDLFECANVAAMARVVTAKPGLSLTPS